LNQIGVVFLNKNQEMQEISFPSFQYLRRIRVEFRNIFSNELISISPMEKKNIYQQPISIIVPNKSLLKRSSLPNAHSQTCKITHKKFPRCFDKN
jgi:hypothetical protein